MENAKRVVLLPLLFFNLLAGQDSVGQQDIKTTEAHYQLGNYEVVIRQQKRLRITQEEISAHVTPNWCSVSVEINENGGIINKLDFIDIHGYGGRYGIYLPIKQESPKHVILMKYGDYDCRTVVITDGGKLFNLGGGSYRIFLNRYLVSRRELPDVESATFIIFDLYTNKVLLSKVLDRTTKGLPELFLSRDTYDFEFYANGPEFFVGIVVQVYYSSSQTISRTRTGSLNKVDLRTGAMTEAVFDPKKHKEFIIDYSNIDLSHNCECNKRDNS